MNDTVKAVPAMLRALISVGGVPSINSAAVLYTGKAGKSGKFK